MRLSRFIAVAAFASMALLLVLARTSPAQTVREVHTFTGTSSSTIPASVTIVQGRDGAVGQQEKVLHSFNNNGKDGSDPSCNLVFDKSGNLYGTTESGGVYNSGTVFELTPRAGGAWTLSILHNFNPSGKDGVNPRGGLVFDSSGNLYGTTYTGGGPNGGGTVFELVPQAGGGWSERILHSFGNNSKDGKWPLGPLILDASGNLFGTTIDGGDNGCSYGCGIVFELVPQTGGAWAEKIPYSFSNGLSGYYPGATLIFDSAGNLYGVTNNGGSSNNCAGGCGTVFELKPSVGAWTEAVLYNFTGNNLDGQYLLGGVLLAASGNLYGTTYRGGTYNGGTVFELASSGGGWVETVLHSFGAAGDVANPFYGTPVFDASGNLYGTAANYGAGGLGAAFKLTPAQDGTWTESLPVSFDGTDGWAPLSGLIFDARGNLYGTTSEGGANTYYGTVFEIVQ